MSSVMGDYVSVQELIDRLGAARAAQLTADSGTTPDEDMLADIVDEAEGEINRYVARRSKVPVDLSAHPELRGMLRGLTLDVAVYRAHLRRPPVPEATLESYRQTIAALKELAKGDVFLPAATTPESTAADQPMAAHGSSASDFDRET